MTMYCPECGADIEEDMQFCPECGGALAGEATANDGASSEHPVTGPSTNVDISSLFSKKMMTLAVGVGLLVVFLGAVVCNVAGGSGVLKAGLVLYNLGGLVLGGTLFLGSLVNEELDRYLRVGLLVAGALVVGLVVTPQMVPSLPYGFP